MKPAKRYSDLMSELLKELTEMSNSADVPVGALVLDKNLEVIAKSFNNRVEKNDPTAHAEIEAIRIAGQKLNNWRLDDCTLIVTLEPCQMCSGAILQSRISRVVFGAFEPKTGFLVSRNSNSENTNIEIISGVMEEKNSKILSDWFRDKRSNKDMI
ncbi:CMP deaminase [freshwater metagenome]|uniref:tRNA-specific adenosine deaminase 2 n=1 Tax=freshwater metagenome TaxID=449393 RepID=A0A094Q9G7_9ZZZZ